MKNSIRILLLTLVGVRLCGQTNPLCDAILCAQENYYYIKFSKSEDNAYNCVIGARKKKDAFYYEKKAVFRSYESKDNALNGVYQINYRSGKTFLKATYQDNFPVDSTLIFYESGSIKSKIKYLSRTNYEVIHYYESSEVKQRIVVSQAIECADYSNLYNSKKSPNIQYFDKKGNSITKQEYQSFNVEDE